MHSAEELAHVVLLRPPLLHQAIRVGHHVALQIVPARQVAHLEAGLGQLLHEHLADSLEQALGRPLQLHCGVQLPHNLLEELVAPAVGQYLGSVVVVSEGVDVLAHFLLKHGLAAALGLADLSQLGLDCSVVLPLVDLVELVVDELIRRHGACFLVIRH